MQKYEIIEQIGEGTYGIVLKCRNKETNDIVAVKKFKEPADPNDPIYIKITTREVKMLRQSKHPFVVNILEAFKRKTKTFLIFEYCESTVLQLIEDRLLDQFAIKMISHQLLIALQHLHRNNIIHRDIKPENLLLQFKQGQDFNVYNKKIIPLLKLCDFGFARQVTNQRLTEYVATRWYRAPELIIGDLYDYSVDIWAFGLVLYEMVTGEPLLPGDTDLDMLYRMQSQIGPVCHQQQLLLMKNPKFQGVKVQNQQIDIISTRLINQDKQLIQLIKSCVVMEPGKRISIENALKSSYFDEVRKISGVIYQSLAKNIIQDDFAAPVVPEREKLPIRSKSSFVGSQQLQQSILNRNIPTRQVISQNKLSPSLGSDYYLNKPPSRNSMLKTTNRQETVKVVQRKVMQTYCGTNLPGIRRK